MTIVRHDNPFPAIWTGLTGWWEERRQLQQMPAVERRNWKAERDTTRRWRVRRLTGNGARNMALVAAVWPEP